MLTSSVAVQIGFNVETVEYKNISFTVWDVGGQDKVGMLNVASYKPALIYTAIARCAWCHIF